MRREHAWPQPADLAEAIVGRARERGGLLMCSDFDGTLAPIAATPEAARAVPAALGPLAWMSREGAGSPGAGAIPLRLAVVTSRDADDVVRRLGLGPEAAAIGCSGLELWIDGHVEVDPRVTPWLPDLARATEQVAAALDSGAVPGARLERKRCGSVVHTRGLPVEADARALSMVRSVAAAAGLAVVLGKRAAEMRPPVRVDKADAVALLRTGRWEEAALCVAGDDLPDVAMLSLAAAAPGGTAVAVADAETPSAVLDVADVAVEGPWGWAQTLAQAVRLLGAPA